MNKDPFTHQIIGKAMDTHRALGPGLNEEFYHQELSARLTMAGIEHLSKPRRDLVYRGFVADTFEADLVFENHLITELKALRNGFAPEHFVQLLSYNKFWRIRTGLLLDFGKASMIQQRVIHTSRVASFGVPQVPAFVSERSLAERLVRLADQCLADIGLGYRETTWTGIMAAALRADDIPFVLHPAAEIGNLGKASLRCIVVASQCAILISALGKEVSAAERATLQTCLKWLDLPWGIAFQFGTDTADCKFVTPPKTPSPQTQRKNTICGIPESVGPTPLNP